MEAALRESAVAVGYLKARCVATTPLGERLRDRLKQELHDDPAASSRRQQAARERAARERKERLARALATMDELDKVQLRKKASADKRKRASPPDDEPPSSGPPSAPDKGVKAEREPRVSTTDREARVMKMADGGFRPAFNAKLAVDTDTQIIAALELTNAGTDMQQMAPMHAQLRRRYGRTPQWLADGGFAKLEHLEALSAVGTEPYVPVPASRNPAIDPHLPKSGDSAALARWRTRMGTAEAADIYKARAASVECANAQLRRRGLHRFNVCGTLKVRAVLLWHALAHNLMRVAALEAAPAR